MITAVRPAESRVRWTICALLFFATTINYVDRQVLSMLAKTLETSIGWNNIEYSNITTAFTFAYAIGMMGAGRLLDKFGTRIGFGIAVAVWSVAAMAHAAATTAFTFGIARVFLGFGEAANFPACIKTVAEWFPKRERAAATGLFNAGTNVGAIVAPLTVPWLASAYGWQAAFIATGALGFVWLAAWFLMYSKPQAHSRVSKRELALIESDPADRLGSYQWVRLLPKKETWAFAVGKFLTRSGPGLHHVAYRVADVEQTLGELSAAGLRLIDEHARTGIRGSQVAFLHPSSTGGVLTEIVQPTAH